MKTTIVIPARLNSTRLERKLLLSETGKFLIQHTYEAASQSQLADQVVIATDSSEIFDVARAFGADVVMTSPSHQSGTDRVAEAALDLAADVIVNVQGDEPEICASSIDELVQVFLEGSDNQIATLATPISTFEEFINPSCVKVTLDCNQHALYFSRSPIPGMKKVSEFEKARRENPHCFLQHIGIYAYRASCLQEICQIGPSKLEKIESLEQLRFLDQGYSIRVRIVDHHTSGIDTAEDYASFVNRIGNG